MSGRRPEVAKPSGFGDAATAAAAAAAGEATAHVWGRPDAGGVDREDLSGFCEQPPPVGSRFPPSPFLLCRASVFCTDSSRSLPKSGEVEFFTLVKPESMRGSLQSLGYVSRSSRLPRARQVSEGAGGPAVPGGGRAAPGFPRGLVPATRLGRSLRGKSRGRSGRAAGRIPAGPGRVEAPASGSLPGSRFSGKGWAPGTVLGADGTVTPASGLVPFTEPKCVHVLLLRLHSLVFPAGIY